MLSNQWEDLNKAILYLTESILFSPLSWLEHGPRILQALFLIALALVKRSRVYRQPGQPGDAIHAAIYLRHLRGQPHQAFGIERHKVTGLLVDALAIQAERGARNVVQNIEEMTGLCRELFAFDMSNANTIRSFFLFFTTLLSNIDLLVPDQTMEEVIECLRAAKGQQLFRDESRGILAYCLITRYCITLVNDDYEEATSIMDELITSSSPGDIFVAQVQQLVAGLAIWRANHHGNPEYSEVSAYRARSFLDSSPQNQLPCLQGLANHFLDGTTMRRFRYFGSIDGGFDASSKNPPLYEPLPSSYTDSFPKVGQLQEQLEILNGLLDGIRNNEYITDIEEAIEIGRTMLPQSATREGPTSWLFMSFGEVLFQAFRCTTKIEYINEAISAYRQGLAIPLPPLLRYRLHQALSLSLVVRYKCFPGHQMQDLEEALEILSQCVNSEHGSLPHRCWFACQWASIARHIRHPSISKAYESAVSLIQDTLLFAPTLQQQHATLATTDHYHEMSLDYASYQVDLHQLKEAIVTLETGRALLWSEMRHFHTSTDQLLQADPQLGQKFAAVNRDLEELTKSIPPSHRLNMEDGVVDDLKAADSFGRLLMKQRRLLKERNNLISQIQALPGFENFLASPSFDALRSAASSGPVIIINHSEWRSDILILLHNTSPILIPTPDYFYSRTTALKDKLLDSRHKYGLDSNHYDKTLASVLSDLYHLVGKPVIDGLRQLEVPEQSRIWWCPTSVFCSLPLHAMGPILSDDGEKRYFLDLYICSYTPTLSALIQSRNRDFAGARSYDRPSLLLVAQPGPSLPTVLKEIQVVQALDAKVTSLISEAATSATVISAFHRHQFVHFACHGTLEAGKPFEARFELFGGERLTLLEIVRSHIPTAEFAFLSACHTAEITQGSSVDEGLHLTAAVQYCGFRSVVGTMWAMADADGEGLANQFYKNMFWRRRNGERVRYERSAKALRDAVKKLRRKRGITLERWVNFVHYGA